MVGAGDGHCEYLLTVTITWKIEYSFFIIQWQNFWQSTTLELLSDSWICNIIQMVTKYIFVSALHKTTVQHESMFNCAGQEYPYFLTFHVAADCQSGYTSTCDNCDQSSIACRRMPLRWRSSDSSLDDCNLQCAVIGRTSSSLPRRGYSPCCCRSRSPAPFLYGQVMQCPTHVQHVRRQKLCRSRGSCVEQSAIESTRRKTQFSELQAPAENSLVYFWPQHSVNIYLLHYRNILTYLLTALPTTWYATSSWPERCQSIGDGQYYCNCQVPIKEWL